MEHVLDELRRTLKCGIYYPAIAGALILPDACGAAEYVGKSLKPQFKYVSWYDKWVADSFNPVNVLFRGKQVYLLRNALMHEAACFVRGDVGFDRVIFTPPGSNYHFCSFEGNGGSPEKAFQVRIDLFVDALVSAAVRWLKEVRTDPDTTRADAIDRLITLHPYGIPPHMVGMPVIG
jgi:hypothetical protein